MKSTLALMSVVVASSLSFAAPGRWFDRGGERFRNIQGINLGQVNIGFESRRVDSDTLNIFANPRIQCNLTHIKLTALNDSLRILAVEVEYERSHNGNNRDAIDLRDDDDFRRRENRGGPGFGDRSGRMDRGIQLQAHESSPLLDLDDVKDGFPDGRCVRSIRVIGIDTPNRGGRGDVRSGFGRGRGFGGGRIDTPAAVQVEGFMLRGFRSNNPNGRGGSGGHGGGRPGPGVQTVLESLGASGFAKREIPTTSTIAVGPRMGNFRGLRIQANGDFFKVDDIIVYFMDGTRRSYARGLDLPEDAMTDIWFNGDSRDSRSYMIQRVEVVGHTPLLASTKSQLLVSGIR